MTNVIHWYCIKPTPYNNFLFKELSSISDINLIIYYKLRKDSKHPWKMDLSTGYSYKFLDCGMEKLNFIRRAFCRNNEIYIIGGWSGILIMIILIILSTRKVPYVIWTDTPDINKKRSWLKKKFRFLWLKFILNNAILVMATGKPACNILKDFGVPESKIINFPYWVPVPSKRNINNLSYIKKTIVFYSVGQIIKRKGYDLALRAFDKLKINHKNKFEYWIFGDGPEREELQLLVHQLELNDVVKLWGWRDNEFIWQKAQEADVFIHPARWDAYGVSVIEAMAIGKPVVGSDQTMAVIDRVLQGKNGFIHKTGNIAELSEHIQWFIQNPQSIKDMGENSRRIAELWRINRGIDIIRKILKKLYSI
jgi:glycosyltransferase involved in cell wall biosynthesis